MAQARARRRLPGTKLCWPAGVGFLVAYNPITYAETLCSAVVLYYELMTRLVTTMNLLDDVAAYVVSPWLKAYLSQVDCATMWTTLRRCIWNESSGGGAHKKKIQH